MGDLAAFLLTGGPGTGKTTVAEEMGELLRRADARYAVIDLDGLGKTHPPVAGGTFNSSLIFRNLAAIWPNYLAHGIDYMIFARILGSKEELAELRAAIPEAALTVARITSPPGTVARRLTRRDPGVKQGFLLRVAPTIDGQVADLGVEDFTIENPQESLVTELALDVLRTLGWPTPVDPWDERPGT